MGNNLPIRLVAAVIDVLVLPFVFAVALFSRAIHHSRLDSPRIVWGSTPLINNIYWSMALRHAGFKSETFMFNHYSINKRSDFDRLLVEEFRWCPVPLRPYLGFISALLNYEVVVTSFSGFMLVTPILRRLQAVIFNVAGIKTVVMPFGSDAYVYSRIRSSTLLHGLLMSYPAASREQRKIGRDVDYWCSHADVLIPGVMGMDGIGRWDVVVPSALSLDLENWFPTHPMSAADGRLETVTVCHSPNHWGFKGTEFIIEAVEQLRREGLLVDLRILEGLSNEEVRRLLREDVDILVDQIVFTGHGMSALEGMASGLPVVCNLEDEHYLLPARRWSFFGECPLVSAEPENLVRVLRELVTKPELRTELGNLGRQYVEKYHGLDSSIFLFTAVIDYLYGRRVSLMDLYHPLTSDYVKRLPRIVPPLEKNRLKLS